MIHKGKERKKGKPRWWNTRRKKEKEGKGKRWGKRRDRERRRKEDRAIKFCPS
jgi:hypothetical protein